MYINTWTGLVWASRDTAHNCDWICSVLGPQLYSWLQMLGNGRNREVDFSNQKLTHFRRTTGSDQVIYPSGSVLLNWNSSSSPGSHQLWPFTLPSTFKPFNQRHGGSNQGPSACQARALLSLSYSPPYNPCTNGS